MPGLGDLLLKRSAITADQLVEAVSHQQQNGCPLIASLVQLGFVCEKDLISVLHKEFGFAILDAEKLDPSPEALQAIPASTAQKHQVLPISRNGSGLTVATADPSNAAALAEVKFLSGCNVNVVLASSEAIQKAIRLFYAKDTNAYMDVLTELSNGKLEVVENEEDLDVATLARATEEAPVVKLVNALFIDAIEKRASDIHIEPYEKDLRVRFRVDGALADIMQPPPRFRNLLSSRIKILASLDISERRRPQDGAVKIRLSNGKEVSFRISVLPTIHGEKIVIRLVDRSSLQLDLGNLGFDEEGLRRFRRALARPYGMILVTGPTGSGKTTTLYSAVSTINDSSRNISTVEDPVELSLRGVNQVQVNDEIDVSFAVVLRSLLRQDPDVIMVGEIRDFETAEIAVKASLTGHQVFSTLHTNDAPSTVTRLLDMGVEPFLVASSVNLVVAQRLVRLICPTCKIRDEEAYSPAALREMGFTTDPAEAIPIVRGFGCEECGNTGYFGRIALFETMPMTREIREMVVHRASEVEIQARAIAQGMKTLREAGLAKVRAGLTTLDEIVRVTAQD